MSVRADAEQPHESSRIDPTVVLAAACDVAAVALLLFLIVSRISFMDFNTSRELEWNRMALVVLAAGFLVLRLASRGLGARAMLAAFSLLASISLTMLLYPLPAIDAAFAMKRVVSTMNGVGSVFYSHNNGAPVTQMHLTVVDTLARQPLPTVIVVAIISGDLFRSYLRSRPEPGMKRRLEFVNDALVFRDVTEGQAPLPLTRSWRRRNWP